MMVDHALAYADRGFPVFPLHWVEDFRCSCGDPDCDKSRGKHPRTKNGCKDATTDPDQITAWWIRWPGANIGLATGHVFDALDLDDVVADEELHNAWAEAGEPGGFLSDVGAHGPAVRTPSGGLHLHVAATGYGNRTKFIPGADWRGRGGYVVAPPSVDHRGAWEWIEGPGDHEDLPTVPAWLALLVEPPKSVAADISKITSSSPDAIVAGLVRVVLGAAEGERNDKLNWAAYRLREHVAAGTVDGQAGIAALIEAGLHAGLTQREVDRTVRSGMGGKAA